MSLPGTTIDSELRAWIEMRAKAEGFDLAGVASVADSGSADADLESRRFEAFVKAGHAGDMAWLKRADESGDLLRGHLQRAMPWARSVIVCAVNYNPDAPRSVDPAGPGTGWIARYAWSGAGLDAESGLGADYHDVLLPRLRAVEAALRERVGGPIETRCYVDTGPIVERNYAERAGVGWIGKNTCVLNQQMGSWLLLGVIVTSLEMVTDAVSIPAADRCGSCTRCIDACPTDAILPGRRMDASRCISYLTIEKKGSLAPAEGGEDLRPKVGRQVFGCDICQDVCPWNRRAPVTPTGMLPARLELANPALEWLAAMDSGEFKRWFRGSPLERTGRRRLQRNVAVAMGNSGQQEFAARLRAWAEGEDEMLKEAAVWALERLGAG